MTFCLRFFSPQLALLFAFQCINHKDSWFEPFHFQELFVMQCKHCFNFGEFFMQTDRG